MLSYDFTEEIKALAEELTSVRRREEEVDFQINSIIRDGLDLPKQLYGSFNRLVTGMTLAESDTSQLISSVDISSVVADGISSKVRDMDVAKTRVVECLQFVEDILDLRTCTEGVRIAMVNEDYEQAAGHVHRFLTLDRTVLDASSYVRSIDVQGNSDGETSVQAMMKAEKELKQIVVDKFDEAVQRDDIASIQRFFKLFPQLEQHDIGIAKFGAYLKQKIASTGETNFRIAKSGGTDASRTNVLFADALTLLLEGVARIFEVQQPIVDAYYGLDKVLVFWSILQEQCNIEAGRIFDCFMEKRQVKSKFLNPISNGGQTSRGSGQVEKVDPLDLDVLLTEMTLMNMRVDMYTRFLNRRIGGSIAVLAEDTEEQKERKQSMELQFGIQLRTCDLCRKVQELLGLYILMEEYYMRESILKALRLEYRDDDALCSSIVDDVFFIVRKCIRRALSSANVDCVGAMLNHACSLLEKYYLAELKGRLKPANLIYGSLADAYSTAAAAYASVVQQGKIPTSGIDGGDKSRDFFVTLNDCNASLECLERLKNGLARDFDDVLCKRAGSERQKLESCLAQFDDVHRRCSSIVEDGIGQLVQNCVKPRLKLAAEAFFNESHSPNEAEYNELEARNVFVESIVSTLDASLATLKPQLSEQVYASMLTRVAAETALLVEKVVMKGTYNRLGGLLLDKQVRELANFLTSLAGWGSREKFSRLNQVTCLLNVDSVREAKEFCQSDSVVWLLSPSEVRQVLALRIDLPGNKSARPTGLMQ
uniref:Conserved oligomeric Golgi complex subunit 4 n=1 Tax=Trichuris muris TaxID=70415 RepID=A0A5S6QN16_TRIMR